jgi:hypothetical protein
VDGSGERQGGGGGMRVGIKRLPVVQGLSYPVPTRCKCVWGLLCAGAFDVVAVRRTDGALRGIL